jgi:hypothetical protein
LVNFQAVEAEPHGGVGFGDPSVCRDGQGRSPFEGLGETSRAAGAGRTDGRQGVAPEPASQSAVQ